MASHSQNKTVPALRVCFNSLSDYFNNNHADTYYGFRDLLSYLLIEKTNHQCVYSKLFNRTPNGIEINNFTSFVINKCQIIALGEENISFLISCVFEIRKKLADHFKMPNLSFSSNTMNMGISRSVKSHPEYYVAKSAIIKTDSTKFKKFIALSDAEKLLDTKRFIEHRLKVQADAFGITLPDNLNVTVLKLGTIKPIAFKTLKNGRPLWYTSVDIIFSCQLHIVGPWYLSTLASKGNGHVSFCKSPGTMTAETESFINQLESWVED